MKVYHIKIICNGKYTANKVRSFWMLYNNNKWELYQCIIEDEKAFGAKSVVL